MCSRKSNWAVEFDLSSAAAQVCGPGIVIPPRFNIPVKPFHEAMSRIAAGQFGVASRSQLIAAGLSRNQIQTATRAGAIVRELPCVYRLSGVAPTWETRLMAAVLWAGPGGVVSHRAAGKLHKLAGVECRFAEITLTDRRRPPNPFTVVHYRSPVKGTIDKIGVFPVASPALTLIDLSSLLPVTALEIALDDALRRRIVTCRRIAEIAKALGGSFRGSRALLSLLEDRDGKGHTHSPLETRVLQLLSAAGFPDPVRQFEIRDGRKLIARADFAYPDLKLAIECDGYAYHSGFRNWSRDRRRLNSLFVVGWRVLSVTASDLARPAEWLQQLQVAIYGTPLV